MQRLTEIRQLLAEAGLRPQRRFGQSFLIDGNLMRKLLELAELTGHQTVLEVGPGTGSLTEELLDRAELVVAVEIDRGLRELLRRRLAGRRNLVLLLDDVMAGRQGLSPVVLAALGPRAHLVANLPYSIATPLVGECLVESWRAVARPGMGACRFERLTFTVQQEVAERLIARSGTAAYGPISIWTALLGRVRLGPAVPASAFWPAPKVAGRIVRVDFDPAMAGRLADADVLAGVLATAFQQRRKQIGSLLRRSPGGCQPEATAAALEAAMIDPASRAEDIRPEQFLALANMLPCLRRG